VALEWFWSAPKSLIFNALPNITQTLDFQQFYASFGAGRVGQG